VLVVVANDPGTRPRHGYERDRITKDKLLNEENCLLWDDRVESELLQGRGMTSTVVDGRSKTMLVSLVAGEVFADAGCLSDRPAIRLKEPTVPWWETVGRFYC